MKIKILKRKKILGAVQKLPAKQHSQFSPIWVKMGWIGCAIQQVTAKRLPQFFSYFQEIFFLNDFIKNPQTRNARAFLPLNISAVSSVSRSVSTAYTVKQSITYVVLGLLCSTVHTACHWCNKGFEFFIVFFPFHLMVCGQCSFIIAELGHSCHQQCQERMNKKQTDEDKELWVGWDSATYFVMCKRVKMTILFLHFGLQWCCLV